MVVKRDEVCSCRHREVEVDHTADNGCEWRECTCTWWPIIFENTRTQIVKWYSITGAPRVKADFAGNSDTELAPFSAKFVFIEGEECTEMLVNARLVLRNGELNDRVIKAPFFIWNQREWPEWLHDLYKLACIESRAKTLAR